MKNIKQHQILRKLKKFKRAYKPDQYSMTLHFKRGFIVIIKDTISLIYLKKKYKKYNFFLPEKGNNTPLDSLDLYKIVGYTDKKILKKGNSINKSYYILKDE